MKKNIGILYIILAAASFAFMNLFVKASGDLPTVEKAFFRNVVAMFFAMVVIKKQGIGFSVVKGARIFVVLRAVFGTIGILTNFYAISNLNISDASMLNKLSPFFAILFSFFMLKERVKPYQIICVVMAFVGALFIMQPTGDSLVLVPALLGFISGAAAGMGYTNVRVATKHGAFGPQVVFYFSFLSTVFILPLMILKFEPMSPLQLVFLLLAGLSATGGQFAITAAYTHAPAKEISVYDYSQVAFAAVLGYIFLGELPNGLSFIGYAVIILAGIYMFFKNKKAAE